MTAPTLSFGLSFNDLYDRDGLSRLDAAFAAWLKTANADVHARLMAARTAPESLAAKDESNLLIEAARPLEDFVGELFGISGDVANLRGRDSKFAPLYDCKRLFVQRYVTRAIKPDAVGAEPAVDVGANPSDGVEAWELAFAVKVRGLVGAEFKVDKPTPEVEALDAEFIAERRDAVAAELLRAVLAPGTVLFLDAFTGFDEASRDLVEHIATSAGDGIGPEVTNATVKILAAAGFAIWVYRHTVPEVTRGKRIRLILLRSLALAILLFLIFEPHGLAEIWRRIRRYFHLWPFKT